MADSQTIHAGFPELTYPATMTDLTGKPISTFPVHVALGTDPYNPPATDSTAWKVPNVVSYEGPSAVTVQLLVDASTPPGVYYLWIRIVAAIETPPRRGHRIKVR